MKKLLLLLFLPLTIFSQEVLLDHSYIEDDSNGFEVGDVITVKFNMLYPASGPTPTYMFVDYQFNNKLLDLLDVTFLQGEQTWYYEYTGYNFTGTQGVDPTHLSTQQQTGISYQNFSDGSIVRFSLQGSQALSPDQTLVEFRFVIKDKANTNYSDYSNLTQLNWIQLRDNATGYDYNVHSLTQNISLNTVRGGDAGSVTLNLNTNSDSPTHYTYRIEDTGTQSTVKSGYFDQNYQAIVTGLENDKQYHVYIDIDDKLAAGWLDNVVTVSDAYIVFQQNLSNTATPGGNGAPFFQYSIQYLLGEVDNSGNVTSDDSYVMLNHIMGNNVSTWFTSQTNGGYVYSGRVENYGVATNQYYFGMNPYITPTDVNKIFDFATGLVGDADFSHSFIPTTQGSSLAKSTNKSKLKSPENYNLDVSTSLVDGKVVLEVNLDKDELAGIQFNIQYDPSVIEFTNIEFNTGNEMVNFSTPRDNKLYFGSIDTTGKVAIKKGKPYKLVFTPKVTLTNTSGLIFFNLTDAVKLDGTKVILKLN
jgi:hypothetical protein